MPELGVMVIAIWCGESKPTVLNDFLEQFAEELNDILLNGVMINGYKLCVHIRCFICDSPARAMIKGLNNLHCERIYICKLKRIHPNMA